MNFLAPTNERRLHFVPGAFTMQHVLQIFHIVERTGIHFNQDISEQCPGIVRRASRFRVHHQQTRRRSHAGLFLKRLGNLDRLHHEPDIRLRYVSFPGNFFGNPRQRRRRYRDWFSAKKTAGVQAQHGAVRA